MSFKVLRIQKGGSLWALVCGLESLSVTSVGHSCRTKVMLTCDTLAKRTFYCSEKDTPRAQTGTHWAALGTRDSRQENSPKMLPMMLDWPGLKLNPNTSEQ